MAAFWKGIRSTSERSSLNADMSADPGAGKSDVAARLQLLDEFENSGQGWFWATDASGGITYMSPSAAAALGVPVSDLLGRELSSLFILASQEAQEDERSTERTLPFLMRAKNTISNLELRADVDGKEIWWAIFGRPQYDANRNFMGYRGNGKDITELRRSRQDASRMAMYDSLTGLANRHRMGQRLSSALKAYRISQRSCALIMLDLDRFKQVNDTLGHQAGDELLKQVAQRLTRIIGTQGEIGRLGGDEFQIMLPDLDDRGELGELASRLIQMISQPYTIEGSRCVIGTSVGVAVAPYDGLESDDLVRAADLALYAAKGGGRGQYRFYSNDLKDVAEERRQIEEDLRDALVNDQIQLHYQPIVRAEDNIVTGFEALMRWEHPERGWISPVDFIGIAEESNLIKSLGAWVLRKACEDAAAWPDNVRVAVNVSPIQFATPGFTKTVATALASSGINPDRLELEITETVFMGDRLATEENFSILKKLGVRLAVDDFGTGYSSLGYLRTAPFDKIKIDRSFVETSTEGGSNNSAIIAAITSLASALGMDTTVEGVETFDQLDLVRQQGGTHIQGFIYSRALRYEEVNERFSDGIFKIEPSGPLKHRPDRRAVFLRIGVIHADYRYEAMLRDISRTGARVEGLLGVPVGTELVLDLGQGQLVVAVVVRSNDAVLGVEFETPLISDGAGGFCTRHRVSPYALAAAGMPLTALGAGTIIRGGSEPGTRPLFMQVEVISARSERAA
jgi:diguanylate cyclase (GGDEF)-like protein/PAS domain S-box-containing protein